MIQTKNILKLFVMVGAVFFLYPQTTSHAFLDLTAAGSSGFVNGGFFTNTDNGSTGSGVINSFVRIASNSNIEQGYNTDGRPTFYDENSSPTFTKSLLLSTVPIVTLGGIDYREFLLDINQERNDPLLSLDSIQLFLESSGTIKTDLASLGTPLYNLDGAGDTYLLLNYSLNSGSGSGDLFAYIPNSLFTGPNQYVYLYSKFGATSPYGNNDGYEEWAVRKCNVNVNCTVIPPTDNPVPEPSSMLLFGSGLLAFVSKRRNNKLA